MTRVGWGRITASRWIPDVGARWWSGLGNSRTRSALPLSESKRMNGRRSSRSAGPFVPRESLQWEPYWRGQILSRCDRAPQVPYLLPDSTMLWVQRSGATSVWASL